MYLLLGHMHLSMNRSITYLVDREAGEKAPKEATKMQTWKKPGRGAMSYPEMARALHTEAFIMHNL